MNAAILKELSNEIFKMRNKSGIAWAMKNNDDAHKYENIAVGLEQAYRIIANEMAVSA
jgi:hypothetical protein